MRWLLRKADPNDVATLSRALRVSPLIARLLALRGITRPEDASRFLNPALDQLHSPYLMNGMREAVGRIQRAIAAKEKTFVYGDYDVDGVTAVVVLKIAIEMLGGTVGFHVPHRIREGYGMSGNVLERASAEGYRLLISVDTGIRAFGAAATAQALGLDLIVTDHHLPDAGLGLPQALAVLNPNRPDCGYPCKALCGAGVAFKVAQALLEARDAGDARSRLLPSFLKIVAVATIADAVPLTGENRVIANLGLAGLRNPVNVGLQSLMQVAQLSGKRRRLTASDVGFRLAPRINAAGRMDVAAQVVELFTCRDEPRAREIANKLNVLNGDRQAAEQAILAKILERLASEPTLRDAYCLVIEGQGWHRGVIGITASRIVERMSRPALVLGCEGGEAHGSGRSIPGFHLLEALESCAGLFTRFGGHAHAVGFSLPAERIPELRAHLDSFARQRLTLDDFVPSLEIDETVSLGDITSGLLHDVDAFEPFGMGNPDPVFSATGMRLLAPPRVLKEKHIKLRVTQESQSGAPGGKFDMIGWRKAEQVQRIGLLANDSCDAAFTLSENEHPDFGGIQLLIRDVRKSLKPEQRATAAGTGCESSAAR